VKSITTRASFDSDTGIDCSSMLSFGSDSHIFVPRSRGAAPGFAASLCLLQEPIDLRLGAGSSQSQDHQHQDDDDQHADDGGDDSAVHAFLRVSCLA
jgi:hypothetical protein